MTLGYAVQSFFEILGVAALVLSMIFDDKLSAWERRTIKRIKRKIFGTKSNVIPFDGANHDGRAV